MNNENKAASQPAASASQESIRNDARFLKLLHDVTATNRITAYKALFDYIDSRAPAARAASATAGDWKVRCFDDDDGDTLLSLSTPRYSAVFRCKTAHDNGPTIASQVAHAFADDFPRQEGSEAGNGN